MGESSREIVTRCLRFGGPKRVPRHLWTLPWAEKHYAEPIRKIRERFPGDFSYPPGVSRPSSRVVGAPHAVGTYTDEWGCVFTSIHEGIIGEVREPALHDIASWREVTPPYETLPGDTAAARDEVNHYCDRADTFVLSGCCPRPWERYQFLRGTENALVDLMISPEEAGELLRVIHEFYLREVEFWADTKVDAITFMDDWGSQSQLLIPPPLWRELFRPLYREYCEIAHSRGKFCFMHSDGNILDIFPDLIDIGVDAVNSQLFCMDMERLALSAKGRITFWGEIDRQHVLTSPDAATGREAVRTVARHLYDPAGGVIAQFEMGPGCNPDVAWAVFEEWERVHEPSDSLSPAVTEAGPRSNERTPP